MFGRLDTKTGAVWLRSDAAEHWLDGTGGMKEYRQGHSRETRKVFITPRNKIVDHLHVMEILHPSDKLAPSSKMHSLISFPT